MTPSVPLPTLRFTPSLLRETAEGAQRYGFMRRESETLTRAFLRMHTEAIRYIDFHVDLPEGAPPEMRDSFDALLAPLLLNSALAALRAGGPANARLALRVTDRALANLELNDTDKGGSLTLLLSAPVPRLCAHVC